MSTNQPIGYLVKQLDNELNDYVDTALRSAHGVGRAHWQVLRTAIDDRSLRLSAFTEEARTFYSDDELEDLFGSLTDNGWIRFDDADGDRLVVITPEGEKLLREMMETQNGTMKIAVDGISDQDFETTRLVLARMAENLHAAIEGLPVAR